ncbi:MAG: hypothetical protein HYV23_00160 [Deltaproteobacteria bacterium]|nr:hypothetical protein [Deltaproteobacteria bacterium]
MMIKKLPVPVFCLLVCLFTFFAATPSWALDVYMAAKQYTKTMPDGSEIVMWGFAADQDNDLGTDDGEAASSPGPLITVPPGLSTIAGHTFRYRSPWDFMARLKKTRQPDRPTQEATRPTRTRYFSFTVK